MQFCQGHWDRLREAIEARGLGDLISKDGERAVKQIAIEADAGEQTMSSYDPLTAAHWAILGNASATIDRVAGASTVVYLMTDGPEDPCELPGADGRTWPRCPLCYLGLAHELTCKDEGCKLPKIDGYAWMIDRAADEQVERWEQLKKREAEGG